MDQVNSPLTKQKRTLASVWAVVVWAAMVAHSARAGGASPDPVPLTFTTADRILVLAPHPDDESIACGGVLQQATVLGLPVRVVFFTYGDNNEWSFAVYRKHAVLEPSAVRRMGLLRHDEAVAATARLGVPADRLIFLGYPDFRTLRLWTDHWGERPPLESMLTRVTNVPYANAYRPGAPYTGESVLADLTAVLREFRPTRVFVPHPADFNPDHRALYLFTRVALWDLAAEGLRPALYPYLTHFPKWPAPRVDDPLLTLNPPLALAESDAWCALALTDQQRALKAQAIRLHKTQFAYSGRYMGSFVRANELFGDAPEVSLSLQSPQVRDLQVGAPGEGVDRAAPSQLTEEERGRFVGIEWRRMRADAQALTVTLALSRPLGEAVGASVYACGYRVDVPFARMPKVHIQVGRLEMRVFDTGRVLPHDGNVTVRRRAHEMDVVVPWETLCTPQRILISAQTYLGDIPLDWADWRIVRVER